MKKTNLLLSACLTLISLLFMVSCVQAHSDTLNRFSITPPTEWITYQVTYLAGPTTYDTYSANWLDSLNTFQIENAQSSSNSPNYFSFHFELTGLPFLLLLIAVAAVFIVIVVILVKKSKNQLFENLFAVSSFKTQFINAE